MHYLLIRNAKLAELPPEQSPTSILVCGGRVVGIGQNIQHPLTDTDTVDAAGRYAIPALLGLSRPRPPRVDPDVVRDLNFENATAGIVTIMTVSADVEDNIAEMESLHAPLLNYAFHFPLRQVVSDNVRKLRRTMLLHGVATAIFRFGEERKADVSTLKPNISAARELGLMVLYDLRGVVDPLERLAKLECLCEVLARDAANRAYVVGVERAEELSLMERLREKCDVAAHLCFDPFGAHAPDGGTLTSEEAVAALRGGSWCSLGLAYSASKALKERWPDMTPEIVSRNKLPLLNALPLRRPLSVAELTEFVMARPARFVGLGPSLGTVGVGMSANFIVWDPAVADVARLAAPGGGVREVPLSGRVDYVIMNGQVVVGEKFLPQKVCGVHSYARIV